MNEAPAPTHPLAVATNGYWPRYAMTNAQAEAIERRLTRYTTSEIISAVESYFANVPDVPRPYWKKIEAILDRRRGRNQGYQPRRDEADGIRRQWSAWRQNRDRPIGWAEEIMRAEDDGETVCPDGIRRSVRVADYVAWQGHWIPDVEGVGLMWFACTMGGYRKQMPEGEPADVLELRRGAVRANLVNLHRKLSALRIFGPATQAHRREWLERIEAAMQSEQVEFEAAAYVPETPDEQTGPEPAGKDTLF